MVQGSISKSLLRRLPVYLRYLRALPSHNETVSAAAMARDLGLGEVQVRKDLAKVSHEGRCRIGRSRVQLIKDLEHYWEYATSTGTIVVGTGQLGQAILDHEGFSKEGQNLMAGFDVFPTVKKSKTGKPIYHISRLEDYCSCYTVRIGIIAVPPEHAQEICDRLIACGVRAILNYSPVQLRAPGYVTVQNEDLASSLSTLCVRLRKTQPETLTQNAV